MSDKLNVRECTRCGAEMCLERADVEFYLCPECGTYFDDENFDSMEAAIAYWNKRPYIDSLIARAERAEAMVERLIEAIRGYFFGEESPAIWRKKLSALVVEWQEREK